MLSAQLETTTDDAGHRGLRSIVRRVATLAQVYDQLLGTEMTRAIDFGEYVKSLCANLAHFQDSPPEEKILICETHSILLDLDVVTALGIAVAELVTNSYEHAFPDRGGTINVSVGLDPTVAHQALLVVRDNGTGFTASVESKRHGLGLIRRLVEEVRGTVFVESQQGTCWSIRFPIPSLPVATDLA